MLRALWFFLLLAIAIVVAVNFVEYPGAVAIDWAGDVFGYRWAYRIDTSLGVLVLLVVVFAAAIAVLYRIWRALRGAPTQMSLARRNRRSRKGFQALTEGMVAIAAGDPEAARKHARQAEALLEEAPFTLLLAAQAAQLGGDDAGAKRHYNALLERNDTAFLGVRGLLTEALRDGDREAALRLAKRAHALRPQTPWVLTTLFDLQVGAGQWVEAQATLDSALRHKAVDRERGQRSRAAILVEQARAAEAEGRSVQALEMARKAQADMPDSPAAATLAIRLLAAAGKTRRAIKLAEATWTAAPHPDVAAAYAGIKADEGPIDRLRRLEKLVRVNPEHAESRFTLAEAALAAQLWGEARRHLATLRHRDPALAGSARLCRLMAELEKAERGDLAAAEAWLEKAADAPPSATWTCGKCGATTAGWTAVCGNCGAFDSIAWRPPPRVAPMPPPPELAAAATIEIAAAPAPEAKPDASKPADDTEVVPLRSAGS